jgi:glycerate kinase
VRIVIAPDSFKESLSAIAVCEAIAAGVHDAAPEADVIQCPIADGGEGTVQALVTATGGQIRKTLVRDPLGDEVEAAWGLLGGTGEPTNEPVPFNAPTAVIEMAAASGLPLVPPDRRNPMLTSTYGTGQLLIAALDAGARRIILGIGGSATDDGGAGCAQALGVRFIDAAGHEFPPGLSGGSLADIERIDMSHRDPRLAGCQLMVACDVNNPLCGPRGASAVYGPQKGATPEMLAQLDTGLAHLADLIRRDLGRDVRDLPGAGAAGGLGAGLVAFADATLRPGIEIVLEAVRLAERLAGADLVITGEGRLDEQSMMGKVIHGVGMAARRAGVPAVAICGSIGPGAERSLELIDAYFSIVSRPMPLVEAMSNAGDLLRQAAANVMRVFRSGFRVQRSGVRDQGSGVRLQERPVGWVV